MTGSVVKTSRIARTIRILVALQSAKGYAVETLARMLGVSRRTVFRDLWDLQKAGIPCYFDYKTCSYIIDPKFFLPAPNISTQEALGLFLLVHTAKDNIQLPFKESALWAAMKIENNLPTEIKQYCKTALRSITVRPDSHGGIVFIDKIFAQLLGAILAKQVVNISYHLPREQKTLTIEFNPCHLMYSNSTWYILGWSSPHKGIGALNLSRIEEVQKLNRHFIEDRKFDIQEYLGRAWSMVPEGRLYDVKLKFLPEVANNVIKRQWHSTQKVSFEQDGSAIVEFRVDGLGEITWWILSFGDKVRVLAPAMLRERVIKIAQSLIKQNEQLSSVDSKP
jgi:proteasome accessory factor B